MKNKTLILSIALLFFGRFLFGQSDFYPGYYISHENDTISGLLDYRGDQRLSKVCGYKPSQGGESIIFNPEDIKGFRFLDGRFFVSKTIKTKNALELRFIEYLVNGITNLYYYRDEEKGHYLIEQPGGEMTELKIVKEEITKNGQLYSQISMQYIGLLKSSMADCMEIQPAIDRSELSHKSLIGIASSYHDYVCDWEECIIYQKQVPRLRIKIAPMISIGISELNLKNHPYIKDNTLQRGVMPAVGAQMNMSKTNSNDRITFQLESIFLKNYHYGFEENHFYSTLEEYHLHTYFLQNSASFLYTFPRGTIRPKLSFGGLSSLLLKNNSYIIRESVFEGVVTTDRSYDLPIRKSHWGFLIKAGFDYHLWKDFVFFTDFRYQSSYVFKEDYIHGSFFDENFRLKSIAMDVGVYF